MLTLANPCKFNHVDNLLLKQNQQTHFNCFPQNLSNLNHVLIQSILLNLGYFVCQSFGIHIGNNDKKYIFLGFLNLNIRALQYLGRMYLHQDYLTVYLLLIIFQ
jgi:hypothetical protein